MCECRLESESESVAQKENRPFSFDKRRTDYDDSPLR